MNPGTHNIRVTIGTTFPARIFKLSKDGVPTVLTGYTAFAEVRAGPGQPVIVDLLPTVTDGPNGEVSLSAFTDEQTALWPEGNYVWDLLLEDAGGEIFGPFLSGTFTITTKVTLSD